MRVAFVGLGAMGAPVAMRLLEAGHELRVFDLRSEALDSFQSAGVDIAASCSDAARDVSVVCTCLPDSHDVEQAVLGVGGLVETARADGLLIEMSTIDPTTTTRVAEVLAPKGMHVVDAPIFRSTAHAARGELMFGLGGAEEDVSRAQALLAPCGDHFIHCGGLGKAVTAKLVNNMLVQSIGVALSEAATLGVKAGLDLELLLDVLSRTAASTRLMDIYSRGAFKGTFELGFALDWAAKDVSNALALARVVQSPCPVAAATRQLHAVAQAHGKGRMDHSAMLTVLEEMADTRVRLAEESPETP